MKILPLLCTFLLLCNNSFTFGDNLMNTLPSSFVITADQVNEITAQNQLTTDELLHALVPIARSYARPPISNYKVGAAVLAKSGNIYLGVNLEFPGIPLNQCVHGEQFAISNARSHGETELVALALSAAPCGHCRQFINELGANNHLQILIPNSPAISFLSLLPNSFGPEHLNLTGNLLSTHPTQPTDGSVTAKAIAAAHSSYAPYTDSISGVAIKTIDGKIYTGSYLENAAYNPTLPPLQAALIALVADMKDYEDMTEVVLAERIDPKVTQTLMSREIIKSIAPHATFHVENFP